MHTRSSPRFSAFILTATLILGAVGCTSDPLVESGEGASEVESPTYAPSEEPNEGPSDPGTTPTPDPGSPDNRGALLAAIDTALETVSGAQVYAVESEDGGSVWEIEWIDPSGSRFETRVSTDGSQILAGPERKSSDPKYLERVNAAEVGISEIIDAALAHSPGNLVELELDTESGGVVWEVEIARPDGHTAEIEIDAATGEIIP